MNRLNEILNYLRILEVEDSYIKDVESNPLCLSIEMMEYAHGDQKRLNGEYYATHPINCTVSYKRFTGLDSKQFKIKSADLKEYNIPYFGVQELCYLHDVIEDTNFTFADIRDTFYECGFKNYFDKVLSKPLKLITHDKKDDYETYIAKCMTNPISALAKMIDLIDNMNVLTLDTLDDGNLTKTVDYLKYVYMINNYYHFIERVNEMKRNKKNV